MDIYQICQMVQTAALRRMHCVEEHLEDNSGINKGPLWKSLGENTYNMSNRKLYCTLTKTNA